VQLNWRRIGFYGFLTGVAIWYVSLVGMVETFNRRDVITEVLSMGRALVVVIGLGMGYIAALNLANNKPSQGIVSGLLTGLFGGLIAGGLPVLMTVWEGMRSMFVNASPDLFEALTFSQESLIVGLLYLIVTTGLLAAVGAAVSVLPWLPRRMIVAGFSAVILIGMLSELLDVILSRSKAITPLAKFLFGKTGVSIGGAIAIFIVFSILSALWATQAKTVSDSIERLPERPRRIFNWGMIVVSALLLIILPQAVGPYISQILVLVGLYALMGLGLNIEIGLAGLLDLGFVGFFAIGAYTVGLMTSTGEMGFGTVVNEVPSSSFSTFWLAIPVAVIVSGLAGVFLGIPVLRMRGDYLAIVTLGFAEIIRILVLSNFLQPLLGGAQGILNIPKPGAPYIATMTQSLPAWANDLFFFWLTADGQIKDPQQFYYLIVLGALLVAFVAWRLQNARVGRNWMAMREDEDVAEAMGINLIASKLLAFGIGAAFAGLSGAIFAAQVGSVFPHSFGLIVSINVVSLVIIGGSGSIPGVIVGALVLVGLPELLREFSEYRLLLYGALLVVMMLVKPEGFWPSEVRRRELRDDTELEIEPAPAG
jgi:branched-chain amino acid transport system permease protein